MKETHVELRALQPLALAEQAHKRQTLQLFPPQLLVELVDLVRCVAIPVAMTLPGYAMMRRRANIAPVLLQNAKLVEGSCVVPQRHRPVERRYQLPPKGLTFALSRCEVVIWALRNMTYDEIMVCLQIMFQDHYWDHLSKLSKR